jgi:hypothetical protein
MDKDGLRRDSLREGLRTKGRSRRGRRQGVRKRKKGAGGRGETTSFLRFVSSPAPLAP